MALTEARKASLVTMEYFSGLKKSIHGSKSWQGPMHLHFGDDLIIDVYKDVGDKQYSAKINGLLAAVRRIREKGFVLPQGIKVYCSGWPEAQNRAFHFDANFNFECNIVLGTTCVEGGNFDLGSVSSGLHPGFSRVAVTCIHELGHALHCQSMGLDAFFDSDSGLSRKAATASEVSQYAQNNKKEFVAEVFAGRMVGIAYSPAVIAEYRQLGGPSNAQFP